MYEGAQASSPIIKDYIEERFAVGSEGRGEEVTD